MKIETIKAYIDFRGQKYPNGLDALLFAITEIGETVDAYMRDKNDTGWVRNNLDKQVNLGHELGDVYQMLSIASYELTGKSLEDNLKEKWAKKGYTVE